MLDAARDSVLAVGFRRTTLTEVARRAGVSRMTLYRRWPDMQSLIADLMTREWTQLIDDVALIDADPRERIVHGVVALVRALRQDELMSRIIDVDPELLLPYLLTRRGRSQDLVLAVLVPLIRQGQREGRIRLANAHVLGRSILLAAHGFALSAQTMVEPRKGSLAEYDDQLGRLVEGLLVP